MVEPGVPEVAGATQQLVIGTLGDRGNVERALADLGDVGFTSREIALIVRGDAPFDAGRGPAAGDGQRRFGEASAVACRGFGTLIISGGAMSSLRALGDRASLGDLSQALVDAGLPDADALIYELGLIRGQSLLAVTASSAERVQVAYRLLLRCGSSEVHIYRG
jgi:hypothetical protein